MSKQTFRYVIFFFLVFIIITKYIIYSFIQRSTTFYQNNHNFIFLNDL